MNTPVRVVRLGYIELLKVLAVAALCLVSTISILGLRNDILTRVASFSFIFESIALLFLGILASTSAFALSVPGHESRRTLILPLITLSGWAAITTYSFITSTQSAFFIGFGFACALDIILISLPTASILFFLIRKAAPLKREKIGFLVLLSGAAYGAFGVSLTCIDDSPVHILFWHLVPTLIIAGIGIFFGKKLLNKI